MPTDPSDVPLPPLPYFLKNGNAMDAEIQAYATTAVRAATDPLQALLLDAHRLQMEAEARANKAELAAELLKALLVDAATRMERARNVLTGGNPRPDCNWAMLDTEKIRAALAAAQTPMGGERLMADQVGDTEFEDWLSQHVRSQGCSPYNKQDMRDAYWAGYSEANADAFGVAARTDAPSVAQAVVKDSLTTQPAPVPVVGPDGRKPVAWWNGIRDYDERDPGSPSVSLTEDTWHDIPLYSAAFAPPEAPAQPVAPSDANRWNRLVTASEMEFPVLALCEDPENDKVMHYGRRRLEQIVDGMDEISPFYTAVPTTDAPAAPKTDAAERVVGREPIAWLTPDYLMATGDPDMARNWGGVRNG